MEQCYCIYIFLYMCGAERTVHYVMKKKIDTTACLTYRTSRKEQLTHQFKNSIEDEKLASKIESNGIPGFRRQEWLRHSCDEHFIANERRMWCLCWLNGTEITLFKTLVAKKFKLWEDHKTSPDGKESVLIWKNSTTTAKTELFNKLTVSPPPHNLYVSCILLK